MALCRTHGDVVRCQHGYYPENGRTLVLTPTGRMYASARGDHVYDRGALGYEVFWADRRIPTSWYSALGTLPRHLAAALREPIVQQELAAKGRQPRQAKSPAGALDTPPRPGPTPTTLPRSAPGASSPNWSPPTGSQKRHFGNETASDLRRIEREAPRTPFWAVAATCRRSWRERVHGVARSAPSGGPGLLLGRPAPPLPLRGFVILGKRDPSPRWPSFPGALPLHGSVPATSGPPGGASRGHRGSPSTPTRSPGPRAGARA